MVKATHKSPAPIRYEQSHPTISLRLSRDVYDLLQQRLEDLGGISFANFIKESLGLLHTNIEATKETAWSEGYNQAEEDYEIRTLAQDSSPLFQTDKTIWLLSCKAWTRLD